MPLPAPERSPLLSRGAVLLLTAASVWVLVLLGLAITRTAFIEQDAAYYCIVAEHIAAGEGATSLTDRRGPVPVPATFPAPFHANTYWPWLLAPLVWLTGEARVTGTVVSLLALVAALWLGAAAIRRTALVPAALAAFAAIAALLHRRACEAAVLPLTDTLALAMNAAALAAIAGRQPVMAVAATALGFAARWQNIVLVLPLLALLPAGRLRARAVLAALALAALVTALRGGSTVLEGMAVMVNPFHSDSLFRGLRFLSLPALVGLWYARRVPTMLPVLLLATGHLLVLLAHPASHVSRPWLFANRHALPVHLAAAALAALAIYRARGWLRLVLLCCLCIAFVENARRPWKALEAVPERTARPEVALAVDWLRDHPLPDGAVLLSQDCDLLALELELQGVHLRGHTPPPPQSDALAALLRRRGISHVLLTWNDHPALTGRNRWMDGFAANLVPRAHVLLDICTEHSRALLLRMR